MSVRTYRYHLVNVFVESDAATFGGNPLCVFEDAQGMTEVEMQALAAQFNLSETTFILPEATPDVSPQVRIFTPAFEMPFAGHPTLGTAAVVAKLAGGRDAVTLRLKAGAIPVVSQQGVWTLTANPHTVRPAEAPEALAAALGIAVDDLAEPARYIDTGSEQIVIPVRSAEVLARLHPNEALLKQTVKTKLGRYLAYVVARVATDRFQVRFFFPKDGSIVEDPGTGSACANLGGYLLEQGVALPMQFTVTQGEFINRLNVLQLSLTAEGRIRVGGRVLHIGSGEIQLP